MYRKQKSETLEKRMKRARHEKEDPSLSLYRKKWNFKSVETPSACPYPHMVCFDRNERGKWSCIQSNISDEALFMTTSLMNLATSARTPTIWGSRNSRRMISIFHACFFLFLSQSFFLFLSSRLMIFFVSILMIKCGWDGGKCLEKWIGGMSNLFLKFFFVIEFGSF